MRVAVYYHNRDIRIEERPRPRIGKGETLLRIKSCGICGSDVMEWYRIKKAPRVLGHEATGEIVEVGKEIKDWKAGDRVFVSHHVPCYNCRYCQAGFQTLCDTLRKTNIDPGGFSEYARIPEINVSNGLFLLPEDVSYDDGTFIEPLACVIRGQHLSGLKKDETVLVLGSGISGLLHIRMAKLSGARVIATDIKRYRIEKAKESGVDLVISGHNNVPSIVRDFSAGQLADLVIVATAAPPALEQAFRSVGRGGRILFFAPTPPEFKVPMPLHDLYFNGVRILFSYAAAKNEIDEAIRIIRENRIRVKELITHRLPLSEIRKGFDLVSEADHSIKVIINP